MSKGSLFWANASGKLGETVLYRSGGEQRTRSYVAKIKNPKTLAQMKNRIVMNNVVSAFHALKLLLQTTFPNRKSNQSAFNVFVQANKNRTPYYISKEDLESTAFVPYGLQVAKGSLGVNLTPKIEPLVNARDPEAAPKFYQVVDGLLDFKNFTMVVDMEQDQDEYLIPTPAQWVEIFQNHCVLNVPSEFQLSVIASMYGWDDADLANDIWQAGFTINHCQAFNGYSRSYGLVRNYYQRIGLHIATRKSDESTGKATLTFDKLMFCYGFETAEDAAQHAFAFILSYKEGGALKVTNSYFTQVPREVDGEQIENPAADYVFGGFYAQQVLEAYGYKANDVLTSEALNINPSGDGNQSEEEEGGEDLTS